jgi:adenylate cyclase
MTNASDTQPLARFRRRAALQLNQQWQFSLIILLVLSLVCAPFFINRIARDAPHVARGELDFTKWGALTRPVQLNGDWGLSWILPQRAAADVPRYVRVPGTWQTTAGPSGAKLPQQGRARFDVTIVGLKPGAYRLFVPTIYSANTVWINGRQVGQRGTLGTDAASTRYHWRAHDIAFTTDGTPLRLKIEMATFLHRDSGMEVAPVIGLPQPMADWIAMRWAQELLSYVALVLLGLSSLTSFFYRRNDLPSLGFAVCAFTLLPYSAIIGFDNIMLMVFPSLGFLPLLWLLYSSTIFSMLLFLLYANALYPAEHFPRFFKVALAAISGLLLAQLGGLLTGDTVLASRINGGFLYAAVIVFSYIITLLVRAVWRRRTGALVFLMGIAMLFVTTLMLAIVASGLVPSDKVPGIDFVQFGVIVLLFSHMVVLSERWSRAINTAERTNSDLRQLLDVNLSITGEMQLETLLAKIVSAITKVIGADRSSLLIPDPKTGEMRSIVAEGVDGQELRFAANTGIAGHVLETGEVVNSPDAYADPRFNHELDTVTGYKTKTLLTMPVNARDGRRLGVIQALNRLRPGPFDDDDEARMAAFAAQAAIAIDNATLFKQVVASRNYNDSILRSMSNGVITVDPDGIITTYNAAACDITGVAPEYMEGADARGFIRLRNPRIWAEIEAVNQSGEGRTLLDFDIQQASRETISINLSIVPLMNEEEQVGVLLLMEDISQGKRLEGAMRRFMTQKVVDQVLGRQDELLFGTACHASVLFADIRNFTTMAETLDPRATVDMLNEVFTDLYEAVSEADGVLDKYIGDAIMAVYGAPISSGRDAENAVASAIRMQHMLTEINVRRAKRGQHNLKLGIGIATGDVVAGTIGSPKRMDYTVIGDSVNLAARLESASKIYQVGIIVCEATADTLPPDAVRELDLIRVKGRKRPVRIYEVLTDVEPASWIGAYRQALASLAARDWAVAERAFAAIHEDEPGDRPTKMMLDRARAALTNPPPADWDGVWESEHG